MPEARKFFQSVEVHRGRLMTGAGVNIVMEGTTNDAFETTITSEPTADRTLTLPNATDTLVGKATTDDLTNKTITSPVLKPTVSIVTANQTLVAADSGKIYIANAADLVFTLPATVAGLQYTFVNAALSTGTGLSVSPAAADNINEGVDNKDLINAGVTDVLGDAVTVVGDGVTGWFTTAKVGTWAAEA